MQTAILTLHILVCLVLIMLVLLQAGREGMGVIFGGGNSSVFGSTGAGGILVKLTAFLAVLFVVTSLSYNLMTGTKSDQGSSILDVQFEEVAVPVENPATSATPVPTADVPATTEAAPGAASTEAVPAAEAPTSPVANPVTEPAPATTPAVELAPVETAPAAASSPVLEAPVETPETSAAVETAPAN